MKTEVKIVLVAIVQSIKSDWFEKGVLVEARKGSHRDGSEIVLYVTNKRTNRREQKASVQVIAVNEYFQLILTPDSECSITCYASLPTLTEDCELAAKFFVFTQP